MFNEEQYLRRIGLSMPVSPSEDGLEQIHRAQGYSIPFENFDILLGKGIDLDPDVVFEKLACTSRGGYCFELNGLFLQALKHFEFEARALLARVHLRGEPTSRLHQLSLVTLNNRDWIADVGFGGGGLRAPIPYELDRLAEQEGRVFRLVDGGHFGTMLQVKEEDRWQDLYSFDFTHVFQVDIETANYFTATNPESFFTQARIAALPNPGGRVSLFDFDLRHVCGNEETLTQLQPGEAYLEAIEQHFGIRLDLPYESLRPVGV